MIKKLLLVITWMVFSASICMAAPFLTCDDPPASEEVTHYIVMIDGGAEIEVLAPLHYDLAGVPDGYHEAEVQAKNIWGSASPSSPFGFTKGSPSTAMGIVISVE